MLTAVVDFLVVDFLVTDMVKLCDETELDILNHCMDILVQTFHEELHPVAAQLVDRLVRISRPEFAPLLTQFYAVRVLHAPCARVVRHRGCRRRPER